MSKELPSQYIAKEHEDSIYKMWEASGAFQPNIRNSKLGIRNFSIIMPPPNANGSLHIGHAVFVALEDIMIRYHRMKGEPTLWLPGADHAGFETQVVYQKKLEKEGRNWLKFSTEGGSAVGMTREELYQEIWDFTQTNKKVMEGQLRKLGTSCDWSREKFPLDPDIVKIVYRTFEKLYADGLVYRGTRIVNWCVKHQTTLSDLEIKHREQTDPLYYIKYGPVTLATVRLETKFGDTAVAVHPKDKRYKHLVGKEIEITTLLGKTKIKVIADTAVDPEFGTGAVKVTPAHDPNDFEIWQRHEKEIPGPKAVIDQYGKLDLLRWWPDNERAKKYHGLKVMEARKVMEEDMQEAGLMEKIDAAYTHSVATCYKCGTIVEPRILPQWYVAMTKTPSPQSSPPGRGSKPTTPSPRGLRLGEPSGSERRGQGEGQSLRDLAVEAVKKGEVKFVTKKFEKIFMHWMKNLRDWNISRQIVWGIRIPAWYCIDKNKESRIKNHGIETPPHDSSFIIHDSSCPPVVAVEKPINCPTCGGTQLRQDPDVFDTWFSSGQWPFATLLAGGRRSEVGGRRLKLPWTSEDFEKFYPTSVMETGWDILPFWVMRMIMLGLYVTGKVPFKYVYLHGLVRDKDRQKMSKSKGNVIDPLGVIDLYGADALRMALVIGNTAGNDIIISEEKIKGYRNFANKVWNASRFVLMNLDDQTKLSFVPRHKAKLLTAADKKTLKELEALAKKVTKHLDRFEFHLAGETLYHYFWHTFADKIIEQMKPRLDTTPNPSSKRRGNESISPPVSLREIPRRGTRGGARGGGSNDSQAAQYVLYTCLTTSLKLLHPFMPFVTEAVWQEISRVKKSMLITEQWPI